MRVPLPVPLALTQTLAPEDRDNEIETGDEAAVAEDIVRDIANFVNLKNVSEVPPKTTTTTTTTPL